MMTVTTLPAPAVVAGAFSLKPLMFEAFVCSMAMMSYVALAGPIAQVLGPQPWQNMNQRPVSGIAQAAVNVRKWVFQ